MKSRRAILEKPKLRRRRRRQLWGIILGVIVVLVLVFVWWVGNTKYLLINKIEVRGAMAVSASEIESLASQSLPGNYFLVFPKKHIFWYPERDIKEKILKKFIQVDQVVISRAGFSGLVIKIKERSPVAVVCAKDCFFADRSGFIYALAPNFSKPVYLVWDLGSSTPSLGSKVVISDAFNFIELVANYFNEVFAGRHLNDWQAVRVLPLSDGDYKIIFSESETGKTLPILVAESEAPTSSARNLDLALRQILSTSTPIILPDLQYIDLRFGKKVFYKL